MKSLDDLSNVQNSQLFFKGFSEYIYIFDIISQNVLFKMDSLGETIRKLRAEKKLPLRTVATYLDIDQAILSKVERGQRNATRGQVIKLAEFFKVKENDLLVSWISDKLVYEVGNEPLALKALQVAEEKIEFISFKKTDRKDLLRKIKRTIKNVKAINKAWIFGSFSRGDDNAYSDIDILIDVPQEETFTLFDIAEIQEQIQNLINRKVDIVMLSAILPQVRARIKNDLKLIYEA